MTNARSFRNGGHPVHQFGDYLSFDNPAYQGWTTDSRLTNWAAECQEASTKMTVDARKKAKEVSAAEKKAAFEEEKRRWRKENGLKVNASPPPRKNAEDIEWVKMWMREEGNREYQERQNKRKVDQEWKELNELRRKGWAAGKGRGGEE